MTGFGPLLRKELLEQWRTYRLLVVTIVFALFGIASPLLARYTPELIKSFAGSSGMTITFPTPTMGDAVDQLLKNVGQTGILAAILLAMGSVAVEKERGTAAMLLTKPASRLAFLAAKLAAIFVTLLVSTAVAAGGAYLYTALLFSAPPVAGFLGMSGLLFLSLLGYATLTFLGSALTRSSIAAAGIGIGAMVLIALVSALPTIGTYAPGNLSAAAKALVVGGDATVWGPLASTVLLVALAFGLAVVSFRRQEL
jgi:ABC-2 type transport system permease protein